MVSFLRLIRESRQRKWQRFPDAEKLTIETIVKIITGESVDSYDGLVSNWHALGGDDALAEAQEWADSNK